MIQNKKHFLVEHIETARLDALPGILAVLTDKEFARQDVFSNPAHHQLLKTIYRAYARRMTTTLLIKTELLRVLALFAPVVGSLAVYTGLDTSEYRQKLRAKGGLYPLLLTSVYDEDLPEIIVPLLDSEHRKDMLSWAAYTMFQPMGATSETVTRNRRYLLDILHVHGDEAGDIPNLFAYSGMYLADGPLGSRTRDIYNHWLAGQGAACEENVAQPIPAGRAKPVVAVVASNWIQQHAIYKMLAPSIFALRDKFEIVLVELRYAEAAKPPCDPEGFDGHIILTLERGRKIDDRALIDLAPDVVYYTEHFTHALDAVLLNRRYAPVQMTGHGIPTSTRSPVIDWVIAGRDLTGADTHTLYTERLCVVPGLNGAAIERPSDSPELAHEPGEVRLLMMAHQQKLNVPYLEAIRDMIAGIPNVKPIFVPNQQNVDALVVAEDVRRILGVTPEYYMTLNGAIYYPLMQSADLMLESYPYGGFTTLMDAASFGLPVLAIEGEQHYARYAAAINRRLGAPDILTAKNYDEFVRNGRELLSNPERLAVIKERLKAKRNALFGRDEAKYLGKAIEKILANPEAKTLNVW